MSSLPYVDRDFATIEECKLIRSCFLQSHRADTHHNFFSNMLLYANDIKDQGILHCMHEVSQRALDKVRIYYPRNSIYLEALTLVQWPEGKEMGVHVDNQFLPGQEATATPWRDFSAVLYLNDDFDDGEIFFPLPNMKVVLKPETGLLVSFPSGNEFPHGVKACANGVRYTMAMWFSEECDRSYSVAPLLK